MPTYRLLPSGKVNAMVRLSGFPTKTRTFESKDQAAEWAINYEAALKTETVNNSLIFEKYLATQVGRGGYESTSYRLRNLSSLKSIPLIETKDIAEYRDKRLTLVSSSTVRLELQLLQRVIQYAYAELGISNLAPFELFKMPKANKPRDKIITQQQYSMLLNDVSLRIKPLVELAYESAMRRSEILSITKSCINWHDKTLLLDDTKNGHSRKVPLNKRAIQVLKEACSLTTGEILFNMKKQSVSKAFARSCNRLGFTELCFHSLRHTAITRYANKRINTMQLQVISGHRDIKMLARYTHIKAADIVHLMEE
ncbi:site-specific integrase [Shewanella sp. A25]|nr:site-specific integrase [Shewanella shenzhenensis]